MQYPYAELHQEFLQVICRVIYRLLYKWLEMRSLQVSTEDCLDC